MLCCLLDGRAYTATELSVCAGISAQSASNHLAKLVGANILTVEKQGRHRYYKYATPEVARVIESMTTLVQDDEADKRVKVKRPELDGMTYARTCYDHLAGWVGVEITNALVAKGIIQVYEKEYLVTTTGKDWFQSIGIDVDALKLQKRSFARQCLDWSERKHHVAGALGASLLIMMMEKDWIRRKRNSREVIITPLGKMELKNRLEVEI